MEGRDGEKKMLFQTKRSVAKALLGNQFGINLMILDWQNNN